jgi:pyruvate/2-oxoglutarate dehydrogenase complex dihydrolipoamide dehydrogenase (E3) component
LNSCPHRSSLLKHAAQPRSPATMRQHYNFIVLGGGSAGYAAARTAREHTDRVAVVDGAPELGGLCILRGCMPSKTLLYSAEVLHLAQHGARFGLDIPSARASVPALHARKRRLTAEFADYRASQLESGQFDLFRHHARFTGPQEITLADGAILTADHFLIATGSVIQRPPLPGLDRVPSLTSDDILDLDHLPPSVLVLGGGVVACELAQFLLRIGSKVTVIQRGPRLLKDSSPEASHVLQETFHAEGMEIFTGTHIEEISLKADGSVRVTFTQDGQPVVREAAILFNALGRTPNTAALGLNAAQVALTADGHVKTDPFQRTSNPAIYAAGDCTGPHEIVHVAILQGEIAARHALNRPATPVNEDHLVKIVFTDPQVATAGVSEKQLHARGIPFLSATYPFADHGKSILMEAKRGYVKIFARKPDGLLLGAECVGRDASELIHAVAVALPLHATVHDLLKTHWYHPTLSEIWTYPLEECAVALA